MRAARTALVLLAALATAAHASPASSPAAPTTRAQLRPGAAPRIELGDLPAQAAVVIEVSARPAGLEGALSRAYLTVFALSQKAGLTIAGPPLARYLSRGSEAEPTLTVEAGFPVSGTARGPLGDARLITLPAGPAATLDHRGRREQLVAAHAQLDAWLARERRAPAGPRWELFLTTPLTTPDPAAQRTRVIVPLAAR